MFRARHDPDGGEGKKPDRRKLATTIIMPSSSAMVSRSTAFTASCRGRAPVATIGPTPTSAMPALSMLRPEILPIASAR